MSQTQVPKMLTSPQSKRADLALIASAQPQDGLIWTDPERLGGEPCFAGTRVPVKHLWDYLEGGESLGEFLEGFPGVTREQAIGVLEMAFRAKPGQFYEVAVESTPLLSTDAQEQSPEPGRNREQEP